MPDSVLKFNFNFASTAYTRAAPVSTLSKRRARTAIFAQIRVPRRRRVLAGPHFGQNNEYTEGLALEQVPKRSGNLDFNQAKRQKRSDNNQSKRTPGHYGGPRELR